MNGSPSIFPQRKYKNSLQQLFFQSEILSTLFLNGSCRL
jgi:hypothetical protein